jgi:hypothetical protein
MVEMKSAGGRRPGGDLPSRLRLQAAHCARLGSPLWPGGEERLLARVGYHGDPVQLPA